MVKYIKAESQMATTVLRTVASAVAGGTASLLGGGKFANGAFSGAFVYLFNHNIAEKIYKGLSKSLKGVWNRKGEILSDAKKGFEGYWAGYKDVRDNAPWYARLTLKIGVTSVELGATSWMKGTTYISWEMFSGATLDSFPTSRYGIMGFYTKAYFDDLKGVYYKDINMNPYDF